MTTKPELIAALAENSGQTKLATTAVLEALENFVGATLVHGGEVTLPGIGKFSVKDTPPRTGVSPANGQPYSKPAGRKVSFKVSKSLKDAI